MCAFKLLVHRPSIVFLQRTVATLLAVSALGGIYSTAAHAELSFELGTVSLYKKCCH